MNRRRNRTKSRPPRPTAMVFADASVCRETGAAGWGAWIKRDGGVSEIFGAAFGLGFSLSADAELCALANALYRAVKWRLIEDGDIVMMQSDNLQALGLLKLLAGATDSPAKGGRRVVDLKRTGKRSEHQLAAMKVVMDVQKGANLTLLVRHIKGHTGTDDGRSWVNRECDRTAKMHMKAKRLELTSPAMKDAEQCCSA